jgi:hypothetical protein
MEQNVRNTPIGTGSCPARSDWNASRRSRLPLGQWLDIYQRLDWSHRRARALLSWADVYLVREEPGDRKRKAELLRESQAMLEEMRISCLAALVEERLQALQSGS